MTNLQWGTAIRSADGSIWDELWHTGRGEAEEEIAECVDDVTPDELVLVRRTRAVPAGPIEVVSIESKGETS